MLEILHYCHLCGSEKLVIIDSESNIYKCIICGYVFDNPRPSANEIEAYYSRPSKYDSWLEMESERAALWNRRLKKITRHSKKGTILDIGTGIGQFLWLAKDCFTKCYGTEVSESAVDIAREKYNLDVVRASIEEIDYKGIVFDNITLFHVLEHVPNPLKVIAKCYDLLDDGGVLFIAVPNELFSLKNNVKKFLGSFGIRKGRYIGTLGIPRIALDGTLSEIHLSHFTPTVLSSLLKRNGFVILEEGLDPYYVSCGWALLKNNLYYVSLSLVMKLFRRNLYDTIWIVAKKPFNRAMA
jgi:SAM-dependent methyltransferase